MERIVTEPQNRNVGFRLSEMAAVIPDSTAVVMPLGRDPHGRRQYAQLTYRELDEDSNRIASGLRAMGIPRGARLVLLVRPSLDFISLVFALLKGGFVTILIDPGMSRTSLLRCLEEAEPEGFVAIPLAHAVRSLLLRRFPRARYHVTVGRRWWWGGKTLDEVRHLGDPTAQSEPASPAQPAAIIFTTGSTGPPKGVLYRHENFWGQVDALRDFYGIQPGEIDLPGFPLFALFNSALGVTTVIPDMDATHPARVNPEHVIEAVRDWNVTQAFGSPAMWNTVGRYCEQRGIRLPSIRRIFSAGAPVPPHVLLRLRAVIHPEGDVHTPYGATESLPVASIAASTILEETVARTQEGGGFCVGHHFPEIAWKVIEIQDEPLLEISDIRELPGGEIGELIVRGPVVTREYATRREANALHKIREGDQVWHRMGDVGYLDEQDRFWFCGRKAHRVRTAQGVMYTIPCEAIFNRHPAIYRSALVGVGSPGQQRPVVIAEPWPEHLPTTRGERRRLLTELRELAARHPLTASIRDIFLRPKLPVDIRHNAKIFREKLAVWAASRV